MPSPRASASRNAFIPHPAGDTAPMPQTKMSLTTTSERIENIQHPTSNTATSSECTIGSIRCWMLMSHPMSIVVTESHDPPPQNQRPIRPAEPERIRQRIFHLRIRRRSHERKRANRFQRLQRRRRRQPLFAQRHQANHRLHRTRRAEQMTDARFRRAHRNIFRSRPGPAIDRHRLRAVVERRAGAVRIDVIDFVGRQLAPPRTPHSWKPAPHRHWDAVA